MKKLMHEYKITAKKLYTALSKIKNNTTKHKLLLSEYQHARYIYRQLEKYCKARGMI